MTIIDFSRSFVTFRIDTLKKPPITASHKPPFTLNNARGQIDCQCEILDRETGKKTEFVLMSSCKSERVVVPSGIWTEPNADMTAIFSTSQSLVLKSYDRANKGVMLYPPSLGAQPERQVSRVDEAFDQVRIDLHRCQGQPLDTTQIIENTLANRILVGRTPGTREFYTNQSFAKAFKALSNRKDADGHDMGDANADPRGFRVKQDRDWDPVRGYRANRERLRILYDYYRDVYLSSRATFSERLLWAALGRMAGGAVLGGLDQLLNTGLTIPPLTADQVANLSPADRADREKQTEVRLLVIGKNIFLDLAYQHEAFLDEPRIALDLAEKHDKAFPAKRSYLQAWKDIISSNPDDIARGNQALLENEQFSIIQPIYDT